MNQRFILLIIMLLMFSVLMSCSRMDRGISNEEFLLLTDNGVTQQIVLTNKWY
ncbi:hypothetical protein [Desulfuribacillus alkaliarsenatis]|uniref:hypothetical protein n=1 Tax=Desulfuribacillus alkaliarsenatis TaxID=766136 RepID=UPI0015B74142|nr:hypothetical protein [Desulfuribacillus alkaliarsenatis]